jgi:undecaprenyl-diphosphatase
MIDFLLSLDEQTLLAFNGHHTAWLDGLMLIVTYRFTWIPLYALIVGLLFYHLGWAKALTVLVGAALVILLTDQLCASVIRPLVARLRPSNPDNPFSEYVQVVNNYRAGRYTFPSCHAANTFAIATFLSRAFSRRWFTWAIFIWAFVVSCSRLYLGVHYPSDLIVGGIIGSAIAYMIYEIIRFCIHHIHFRWAVASLLLLLAAAPTSAQHFEYGGEFKSVFDNREGDATYSPAETYFLTQLSPEVGISFDGGTHRVMGGVVWTQPIGCEWDGNRVSPTLYYQYSSPRWRFSMGMLPRTQLFRELPNYISSDSVNYFQRNIRGILIQHASDNGFAELVLDWRGMQSETRREAFALLLQGQWQRPNRWLQLGGTVMLNHLAKQKHAPEGQYVVDNFIYNPYIGADLTAVAPAMDKLYAQVGLLGSLTRDRGLGRWHSPLGAWAEVGAEWWRIGAKSTLYASKNPLFPMYSRFRSQLNDGEPYYASKFYSRTEVYGYFLRNDWMNLKASLDFQVAEDSFIFYQRLILSIHI